jgi:hypothetical protein
VPLPFRIGTDPDILVDLTTAANEFEAGVIVEALKNQGIHAEAFTTAGAVLQWEVAVSQPFRVAVRRADLDRAKAALRALKADSVDLDWDEVDTGTPEPDAEPARPLNPWRIVQIVAAALLILMFLYLARNQLPAGK